MPTAAEGMFGWGMACPVAAPLRYAASLPRIAWRRTTSLARSRAESASPCVVRKTTFAEGDAGEARREATRGCAACAAPHETIPYALVGETAGGARPRSRVRA